METTLHACQHHGVTIHYFYNSQDRKSKRLKCRKCNVDAVTKRRRKLKLLAIEYKGGKCERCGYAKSPRSMDFHHRDPTQKDFGIAASGITRSWEKVKIELDKCLLLCKNCHGEVHDELQLEE